MQFVAFVEGLLLGLDRRVGLRVSCLGLDLRSGLKERLLVGDACGNLVADLQAHFESVVVGGGELVGNFPSP